MARNIHKLTPDRTRRKSKSPGLHSDGAGLYLQVTPPAACSWIFRYSHGWKVSKDGNRYRAGREMGLGPYPDISLDTAREMATRWRNVVAEGKDPMDVRAAEQAAARAAEKLAAAKAKTFKQCAEEYIDSHSDGWRNVKHGKQWRTTLETYAYPHFGDLSVRDVDLSLVHKALEPIWRTKTETASRVRGRIESVLDWARTRGYRDGENPARWHGHLENIFPARSKVRKVRHHAALPYREIGALMAALKEQGGIGATALQFAVLTATRTSEVIGATWPEIDFENRVWTIPAARIKMGREHRVPLSESALAILRTQSEAAGGSAFVFGGVRANTPISNMTMLKALSGMGRDDLTVHGFRSTFRDWAAEQTNFPREVCEHALAHSLPDKVEAAYRRGDLFDKRRKLMAGWAAYCAKPAKSADVIQMQRSAV